MKDNNNSSSPSSKDNQWIKVNKDNLMEFINFANECCAIMDDEYVAEWLTTKNSNLNMETPIDVFHRDGMEQLYRLLFFIERDEADLV